MKKGLSSAVGMLLIILVGIVALISVMISQTQFLSTIFVENEAKTDSIERDLKSVEITNGVLYATLDATNITISKIKLGDNDCNISKTFTDGMNNYSLTSCLPLKKGVYEVSLFTSRGTYSKSMYVEDVSVSCTLDGIVRGLDQSYNFYNTTTVPYGKTCAFQTRTCQISSIYSGSALFQYSSCAVGPQDTTPNAFSFTNVTNIPISTLTPSNSLIPVGYDGPLAVSVGGSGSPQISVNGGGWTTSTTMMPGQTLQVRLTSSASYLTPLIATVTLGTYSVNWKVTSGPVNCSTLPVGGKWIKVPALAPFTAVDFCVMKYEAKFKDLTGKAMASYNGYRWDTATGDKTINSSPNYTPIVYITQTEAKTACEGLGAGYTLISNNHWMSILRNAEVLSKNWGSGVVGSGLIMRGHTDGSPNNLLSVINVNDGYDGTGQSNPSEQRRTYNLSNNEIIWDLGGNAWEWNSDICTQGTGVGNWQTAGFLQWTDAALADYEKATGGPSGAYTTAQGVGWYYGCAATGRVFLRGSSLLAGDVDGPYGLFMDQTPFQSYPTYSFRCVYTP